MKFSLLLGLYRRPARGAIASPRASITAHIARNYPLRVKRQKWERTWEYTWEYTWDIPDMSEIFVKHTQLHLETNSIPPMKNPQEKVATIENDIHYSGSHIPDMSEIQLDMQKREYTEFVKYYFYRGMSTHVGSSVRDPRRFCVHPFA